MSETALVHESITGCRGVGGNDTISAGKGNDTVYGGEGDDLIIGFKQNNSLHGDDGNDTIRSGQHTSDLFGGAGNDTLVGDLSSGEDHVLSGGQGADSFEFTTTSLTKTSAATITDFELGVDSLTIDGNNIDLENLNTLPTGVSVDSDGNGDSIVLFGDDDTITLAGITGLV